jgi:N-acetylmuramoyl-L-alanine amidase
MKRIALVVGHSEDSQGAVNESSGVTEWNFNTTLVNCIWAKLCGLSGCDNVEIFHRTAGIRDLVRRVNEWNPDLAIEFHCNAFNGKASGTEMLVSKVHRPDHKVDGTFCSDVAHLGLFVAESLNLRWRGVKFVGRWGRGGYFLNKTRCKAIIAESFFIDNGVDLASANLNYDALVGAYVGWIKEYIK